MDKIKLCKFVRELREKNEMENDFFFWKCKEYLILFF